MSILDKFRSFEFKTKYILFSSIIDVFKDQNPRSNIVDVSTIYSERLLDHCGSSNFNGNKLKIFAVINMNINIFPIDANDLYLL